MGDFQQLYGDQKGVFNLVAKLCANYKKDGASRKSREYLIGRRENLTSYWQDIKARHEKISHHKEENPDHEYWSKFAAVKRDIMDLNADIQAQLNYLENVPEEPSKLDLLTKFQEELGRKIDSSIKDHQTSVEHFNLEKLQKIETRIHTLWLEFEDRHSEIIEEKHYLQHSYTTKRVFDTIMERYKRFEKEIHNQIDETKSKQVSDSTKQSREPSGNSRTEPFTIPTIKDGEQTLRYKRQRIRMQVLMEMCDDVDIKDFPTKYNVNIIQQITAKKLQVDELHEDIAINAEDGEFEMEYFTNNIYELVVQKYQRILNSTQTTDNQAESHQQQKVGNIKLPKITVPVFTGKYHEWTTFHDIYERLIHKNNLISDIEKMQYLKSYTAGDAAQLLRHLEISDANYRTAWSLIKERYNNKRKLVNTQLQTLISQPTLYGETAAGIRRLNDQTKECLYAIENLGTNIDSWAPWVVFITLQKLDTESQRLFEQALSNPKELPTFEILYSFLEARFQALEAINDGRKVEKRHQGAVLPKQGKTQFRSFHTFKKESKPEVCWNCSGKHAITDCPKFKAMNPKERSELVKVRQCCFRCLGSHKRKCFKRAGCDICKRYHHTLLHTEDLECEGRKLQHTKYEQEPDKRCNMGSMNIANGHQAYLGDTRGNNVLLATALVVVMNGMREELLRVLIDPGSQASFITEDAVQRLRLKRERIQAKIAGLGLSEAGTSTSKVMVELRLRNHRCLG